MEAQILSGITEVGIKLEVTAQIFRSHQNSVSVKVKIQLLQIMIATIGSLDWSMLVHTLVPLSCECCAFRILRGYANEIISGCWISDPFNTWFGRRGTIFIAAIICVFTPIGGAFSKSWETLFISRLILGVGMGLKGSTVPIFAAENSPAKIRG
jgi:MFS family permease